MDDASRIAAVDEVPAESTLLFRVETADGEEKEAILARVADGVVGWLNYCQHMTHINLDKGSGAPVRNGELVCANHGAMFEADTGTCTFGPCEGAVLNEVAVTVADDDVYLTDPDYSFVGTGGLADDEFDLSSTSNIEF